MYTWPLLGDIPFQLNISGDNFLLFQESSIERDDVKDPFSEVNNLIFSHILDNMTLVGVKPMFIEHLTVPFFILLLFLLLCYVSMLMVIEHLTVPILWKVVPTL